MDDILNRAEELIGEDRLEEAISLLRNVDLVEAYILRSEALRRLGKVEEALRELDAGLEKFPFSYVILATKAEVLESMGRLDEALDTIDQVLAILPYSSEHRFVKARLLFKLGRYEDANLELAEVLRVNPRNVDARIMKAFSYYNIGLKLDALSEVNRALAFKKDDPKLHALKGRIYFETGYQKLALSEYKIASHYEPENPDHYYDIALCYYTLKMMDDALLYVDMAIARGSKASYHALKAAILNEMGKDPSQEIKTALQLDPSIKPTLENLLGVKISPEGNIDKMK
ncbi:tetratricopeptide repeat protein [Metallosphaera javensis (ex Sakai et al. 2022)]|uniref:tetratricopeptide repeat protein n=1 Tax=Metallosphaera javensis (ex Sakai et al. 2022) TaxID=2775498 RepID=UPI00258643A8|nr:MAG: beta-barrel assembly-enhancing protease [Metallosphaera javensis (ex Sakai et al. 2022)]